MAQVSADIWEVTTRASHPDPILAYGRAVGPWDGGGVLGLSTSAIPQLVRGIPVARERCIGGPVQREGLCVVPVDYVRVAGSRAAATVSRELDVSLTHGDVVCDGAEVARRNMVTASVESRIGFAFLLPIKGSQPGACGRIANVCRLPGRRAEL